MKVPAYPIVRPGTSDAILYTYPSSHLNVTPMRKPANWYKSAKWALPSNRTFSISNGSGESYVHRNDQSLSLSAILASFLGAPVLDETGLKGTYNYSLEFADPRLTNSRKLGRETDSRPDLFHCCPGATRLGTAGGEAGD
jgi:uncharacterized protein (TIGR03435 family)